MTELRTKTKKCLQDIKKVPKYVFVNNHPIAVLIGISEFEEHFSDMRLVELDRNELTPEIIAQAKSAKKAKKSDLVIFKIDNHQ